MTDDVSDPGPGSRFRATLVRVLVVQVVALAVLGLVQILYSG